MISPPHLSGAAGLLVDTNILVLYTVGTVNRSRITNFKRTSNYTPSDYDLLINFLGGFTKIYTLPHVLAEVSNLTDLPGHERPLARRVLRKAISLLAEVAIPSAVRACGRCHRQSGTSSSVHCADGRS